MSRPLVGISCGNVPHLDWDGQANLDRDGLNRLYSEAVAQAGGVPFIIPMTRSLMDDHDADDLPMASSCGPGAFHINARAYASRMDALLLSGGGDIAPGPADMSAAHLCTNVDQSRDIWEAALFAAALEQNKPILGICRGVQLMNCALGGTLWQDLSTLRPGDVEHQQKLPRNKASHYINIVDGSCLASTVGEKQLLVNSHHHQGIKNLAGALKAAAHSDDGLVEAVEHCQARFALGVQWHPEGMLKDQGTQAIFTAFVQAAKENC